jgi:hypothetical protein
MGTCACLPQEYFCFPMKNATIFVAIWEEENIPLILSV